MKKILLFLFNLLFWTGAFAQTTSTIKGTVIDKDSKETLIGASVTLKNENKTYKVAVSTGLDGSFVFRNVPAGKYEIEAKYVAYKEEERDFTIKAGETKQISFQIESKANALTEVSVMGSSNGTDYKSRQIERKADQV